MPTAIEHGAAKPRQDIADFFITLSSAIGLSLLAIYLCIQPLAIKFAGGRDFVVYWATGHQLVHHANPFDSNAMAGLEYGVGFPSANRVGLMRNPPWSLFLTYPLGFVGVRLGTLLWSLMEIACWAFSSRLLWILYGRRQTLIHWIALAFGPTLACMIIGQTSCLALLGFVLFLYLHRQRAFLAGASLWLCALKPHLFLLFWPLLLIWVVRSRRYAIVAGALAAFIASVATLPLIDPHAFSQYAQMLRTYGIENEPIPCISVMLRLWIAPRATWIQYLPSTLGCLWACAYFWRRREQWDWLENGGLLILVSVAFAPYCWLNDQCVTIPGLLGAAYRTRSRILLCILPIFSCLIVVMLAESVPITSPIYLWTGPLWLLWWLAAMRLSKVPEPCDRGALTVEK